MSETLVAKDISLFTQNRRLLDSINLTLNSGEITALIGPNGAGKSTLLRVLSGYQRPDKGSLIFNGRPLNHWSNVALSRRRAVMRQGSSIAFNWPVEEIIAMGRSPWPAENKMAIVKHVMRLTGCDTLSGRDFRQLSGGEQQRVQLARALTQLWHDGQPEGCLFLDEPSSALDLYHQQSLIRLLRRLTLPGNLSVCVVVHDLNLAALCADRILLLHNGRLVAQGTPAQVLQQKTLQHWYQTDLLVSNHPTLPLPQVSLAP